MRMVERLQGQRRPRAHRVRRTPREGLVTDDALTAIAQVVGLPSTPRIQRGPATGRLWRGLVACGSRLTATRPTKPRCITKPTSRGSKATTCACVAVVDCSASG